MRIVQLIDSLEPGGAEKMAVNYANGLLDTFSFAGLMLTRCEGTLKNDINVGVHYVFLKRKKIIDFKAIKLGLDYLKENKIDVIQAHSTSIYFGFMLKLLCPKVKLVWHDHYGKSEELHKRKSFILYIISYFFYGIIAVNNQLKDWSLNKLNCKKVIYLPNFTSFESISKENITLLKGNTDKRIICLANLRPQKNHFLLVRAAKKIVTLYPDWTFHLVGKDFKDEYSEDIKNEIITNGLRAHVYLYGSCLDIGFILSQCSIGVLSSDSEGLPVALLEYGLHKLPVVATKVGEIPNIIQQDSNGILISPNDKNELEEAIIKLIESFQLREKLGSELFSTILKKFSFQRVIESYTMWLDEK